MKLVAKKLLLFTVYLSSIFICFELISRQLFNTATDLSEKKILFENQLQQINTLILGNSHGEKAIIPEYLSSNAFNLSYNSQDIYYSVNLLKKYIDQLENLKSIIFIFDYFSLGYNEQDHSPHLVRDYIHTYNILPKKLFTGLNILMFSDFYINKSRFIHRLTNPANNSLPNQKSSHNKCMEDLYFFKDTNLTVAGYRCITTYLPRKQLNHHGKSRSKYHQSIFERNNIHDNLNALHELVNLASEQTMNIYFIISPHTKTYKMNVPTNQITALKNVQEIASKNEHVYYFDLSNIEENSKNFENSDHLNYSGAKKFTAIVNLKLTTPANN